MTRTLYSFPGHGQIAGRDDVQLFADLFDDVAAQAEKMYKSGVPVEDAADQYVVPERFKNIAFSPGISRSDLRSASCIQSGEPSKG